MDRMGWEWALVGLEVALQSCKKFYLIHIGTQPRVVHLIKKVLNMQNSGFSL